MAELNLQTVSNLSSPFLNHHLGNRTGFNYKSPFLEISLLILVALLLSLRKYFEKRRFSKNRQDENYKYQELRGPPSFPIIGMLYHLAWPGVDRFKLFTDWTMAYGKINRSRIFNKDYIGFVDPAYIQKFLTHSNPVYLNKPQLIYHTAAGQIIINGLVFSEYPVWNHHRKVISRMLSFNGIQDQLRKMNFHTKNLLKDLLIGMKDGEKTDGIGDEKIGKLLNTTALEIILHIIMDLEITTMEERLEFHKNLMIAKNSTSQCLKQPWLLIRPIFWLHPLRKRLDHSVMEIRQFLGVIKERFEKRKKNKNPEAETFDDDTKPQKCMMEEMLDAEFSADDIFQETVTMIYGGHETSSWAILCLLMRLALNPEIQETCRKEVDELYKMKNEKASPDDIDMELELTMADLNSLRYLDRCMKESLRLNPIVPLFARRVDVPFEVERNLVIPQGSVAVFCPWGIHRIPEVFPEPEKFDPDRFLPEECAKRHPYSYLPFSGGARNCIGWKIGPLTIKLVTALILRHFEVETTDKWEDIEFEFDLTLTAKNDVNLIFKKRKRT